MEHDPQLSERTVPSVMSDNGEHCPSGDDKWQRERESVVRHTYRKKRTCCRFAVGEDDVAREGNVIAEEEELAPCFCCGVKNLSVGTLRFLSGLDQFCLVIQPTFSHFLSSKAKFYFKIKINLS